MNYYFVKDNSRHAVIVLFVFYVLMQLDMNLTFAHLNNKNLHNIYTTSTHTFKQHKLSDNIYLQVHIDK